MADILTNLDEIIDYPDKIAYALSQDRMIVSLLLDNPNVELNSNSSDILDSQIFNYNFIPKTPDVSLSYITIDTVISKVNNDKIKTLNILITIISNKTNMKLDASKFKSLSGNRRDNLVRFVDKTVRDMTNLGIGKLQFVPRNPVYPVSIGSNDYTAKQLIYEIPNFDGRVK